LTSTTGTFNFQTIDGDGLLSGTTGRSGIYGDTGVQCSQGTAGCTDGNSNTYYDDTSDGAQFPMPGTLLSDTNGIVAGDGSTLLDLRAALDAATTNIELLPSSGTIAGGTLTEDLVINLTDSGLHVLDIANTSDDFDLGNFDIVINGLVDSFLIVRIPDGVNMLTSNSWIGIGTGGIGLNNVLFFTDQENDSDAHFSLQNVVLNGVSFWDLSGAGADLQVDNGQGCAQFIGDQIGMNDVRFNNCAFNYTYSIPPDPEPPQPVPEPGNLSLLLLGSGVFVAVHRRGRRMRKNKNS
jgi:hypothetical protein